MRRTEFYQSHLQMNHLFTIEVSTDALASISQEVDLFIANYLGIKTHPSEVNKADLNV